MNGGAKTGAFLFPTQPQPQPQAQQKRERESSVEKPTDCATSHRSPSLLNQPAAGTTVVKKGMPQMLKGGVIMDVVNAEQARVAEVSDGLKLRER